jgi:hypothetical protein
VQVDIRRGDRGVPQPRLHRHRIHATGQCGSLPRDPGRASRRVSKVLLATCCRPDSPLRASGHRVFWTLTPRSVRATPARLARDSGGKPCPTSTPAARFLALGHGLRVVAAVARRWPAARIGRTCARTTDRVFKATSGPRSEAGRSTLSPRRTRRAESVRRPSASR